jgi:Na+-driven multidrug efflux pump
MAAFYATALAVTALGLPLRGPLLSLLGPAQELLPHARTYLTVLLIGNVFSTGFSAVMRAEGKLRYATLQWVAPITLNIALDALFVLVFRWGVAGSAWATVGSQALSFAMAVFYFARVSALDFKGARLHMRTLANVAATGLPSLVQQGAAALGMATLNHLLAGAGGAPAQTVFAFVSKIYIFAILPFTALTNGLSPVAAHNFGARQARRVRAAFGWACLFALGVAAVFTGLCEALPGPLLRLFSGDAAVLSGGAPALRLLGASLPVMFLPMLAGVLLQAAGKKIASAALFASALLPVLPLALLGGRLWGVTGIWAAFPASGLLATVFAGGAAAWFLRKSP